MSQSYSSFSNPNPTYPKLIPLIKPDETSSSWHGLASKSWSPTLWDSQSKWDSWSDHTPAPTHNMSISWSAGSELRVISLTSAPSKTQNLISFEGHLTKTGARAEQVVTKLHKVIKLTRYHVVLTKTLSDQSSSSTRSGIKKWWELILVKIFWHWSMISSDPSLVKTVFLRKFVCRKYVRRPFPPIGYETFCSNIDARRITIKHQMQWNSTSEGDFLPILRFLYKLFPLRTFLAIMISERLWKTNSLS